MTTSHRVTPIVALDVPAFEDARRLVLALGEECSFYKVGLELFCAEGPRVVEWLRGEGKDVFVDLKLHDIPNTVAGAARSVGRLGATLLTVHASGGQEMLAAAVDAFANGREGAALNTDGSSGVGGVLGVTVLTSHDGASQGAAWGREAVDVGSEVLRLAAISEAAGAAGIVCSGHEAAMVASRHPSLGLLVPGIRFADGSAHDQKRVMTPLAAAMAGARWIILGRAVTGAADPGAAMARVHRELAGPVQVPG